MQLKQFSALAIFLRFFGGGEFTLRQRNSGFLRHDLHSFGKADVFNLLNKREDISALIAAEAVVELTHCVNGKGRSLFLMKRAQAGVVLPSGFLQRDVSADDPDDIRLLLYELSEI